jgi:hypothetical protein
MATGSQPVRLREQVTHTMAGGHLALVPVTRCWYANNRMLWVGRGDVNKPNWTQPTEVNYISMAHYQRRPCLNWWNMLVANNEYTIIHSDS